MGLGLAHVTFYDEIAFLYVQGQGAKCDQI